MSDDSLQPEPFTWHPFKFCFLSLPTSGHISFSWLWFYLIPLTVLQLSSLASLLILTSYFLFGGRLISCTLGKALLRPAKPCSLSNLAQSSWLPPFHPKGPDPDIQSPAIKTSGCKLMKTQCHCPILMGRVKCSREHRKGWTQQNLVNSTGWIQPGWIQGASIGLNQYRSLQMIKWLTLRIIKNESRKKLWRSPNSALAFFTVKKMEAHDLKTHREFLTDSYLPNTFFQTVHSCMTVQL